MVNTYDRKARLMAYISKWEETFNKTCENLAKIFKNAIEETQKEIGEPMDKETKKLCVLFGLVYFLNKLAEEYKK